MAAGECEGRLNPEDQLKRCEEETKILHEKLMLERREHSVSKSGFNLISFSDLLRERESLCCAFTLM
jgi:hypothetical protein